jgi:hypothetical protein
MSDRHDTAHHAALVELRRRIASLPKAQREASYRKRAGLIASLANCLCCYPLVLADTVSEHEEWCPSHGHHLSMLEVARRHGADPGAQ